MGIEILIGDKYMNNIDNAWLAGLLEGEGCFYKAPNTNGNKYLVVQIAMVDKDIIERAAKLMGNPAICSRQLPSGKTCYQIRITGAKARELMQGLYFLLGQRRRAKIDSIINT